MSLLANSNAIESGGYNIDRSLRFCSSASAYLSRNMGSSLTLKTFTFNFWIKLGYVGTSNQGILYFDQANSNADGLDLSGNTLRFLMAGGSSGNLTTTQVFRDPSSWGMFTVSVDTTQATASNRIKLYWNGSQITAFSTATYPSLNYNFTFNTANLGRESTPTNWYFDGYLAEVNFIDGQALTPSSFGQTDSVTGVWVPKKYTGTYGTNGFYLPFSDNTSATTLAYDKSGNGNNWTPNNISTTAGVTYDSMTDVPTLTSATAANYCVLNPLDKSSNITVANGNLSFSQGVTTGNCRSTFGMSSGKWYWEATVTATNPMIGISTAAASLGNYAGSDAFGWSYYGADGYKYTAGAGSAYGATYTTNDVIGVAFDADAGTLTFYKNNTSQGTAYTGLTSGPYFASVGRGNGSPSAAFNFGQRPFSYTPPTGFKALNTFNLPDPTIKKPNQYMDATIWTGTGASNNIVNAGGFAPDLVWTKSRSNAYNNYLEDTVRGAGKTIASNTVSAEFTAAQLVTAFNSNGFTVGTDAEINGSTLTYVGWQWKKGATPGFDIVTYTGTGATQTVNHSLGVAPSMMIIKSRSDAYNWRVYTSTTGNGNILYLNATDASTASSTTWNSTSPTSSVFTVGTDIAVNQSSKNYVAYCFAAVAGYSKFGSYTGNGSTDGPFVYCGFRPKYVLYKVASGTTGHWEVFDSSRSDYNVADDVLFPSSSSAEIASSSYYNDFLSNGFKVRTTDTSMNSSGATYIYAAFAENPFKYSNAR